MSVEDDGNVPRDVSLVSSLHASKSVCNYLPRREWTVLFRYSLGVLLLQEVEVHGVSELGRHQEALHPPPLYILGLSSNFWRGRVPAGIQVVVFGIFDDESELLHQGNMVL